MTIFESMSKIVLVISIFLCISGRAQSLHPLSIKGDYTANDSIQIVEAYIQAKKAANFMYEDMLAIKRAENQEQKWNENFAFKQWLGNAERSSASFRRIKRIHSKFAKRKITLIVTKKNKGRCKGWISAWALPYGKVQIRLCEDFFMYRTHLQEKVLVHEVGHETGLLSHHKIHGCRAALRAATNDSNIAKRSTENYAWLAMSYLGKDCSSR